MTNTRKIIGQLSGIASTISGSVVFLMAIGEIASYLIGGSERLGPPIESGGASGAHWVMILVIILASGLGAMVGFLSWMFVVTRMAWYTFEEIDEMYFDETRDMSRTQWFQHIPPWVKRAMPWAILALLSALVGSSMIMSFQDNG